MVHFLTFLLRSIFAMIHKVRMNSHSSTITPTVRNKTFIPPPTALPDLRMRRNMYASTNQKSVLFHLPEVMEQNLDKYYFNQQLDRPLYLPDVMEKNLNSYYYEEESENLKGVIKQTLDAYYLQNNLMKYLNSDSANLAIEKNVRYDDLEDVMLHNAFSMSYSFTSSPIVIATATAKPTKMQHTQKPTRPKTTPMLTLSPTASTNIPTITNTFTMSYSFTPTIPPTETANRMPSKSRRTEMPIEAPVGTHSPTVSTLTPTASPNLPPTTIPSRSPSIRPKLKPSKQQKRPSTIVPFTAIPITKTLSPTTSTEPTKPTFLEPSQTPSLLPTNRLSLKPSKASNKPSTRSPIVRPVAKSRVPVGKPSKATSRPSSLNILSYSPSNYTWRLDFSKACSSNNITEGPGAGISDSYCTASSALERQMVTEKVYVVNTILILELDLDLVPINYYFTNTTSLKDGDMFNFTSIGASNNTVPLGGLQMRLVGKDKADGNISLSWIVTFSNNCSTQVFFPGDSIGWVIFVSCITIAHVCFFKKSSHTYRFCILFSLIKRKQSAHLLMSFARPQVHYYFTELKNRFMSLLIHH